MPDHTRLNYFSDGPLGIGRPTPSIGGLGWSSTCAPMIRLPGLTFDGDLTHRDQIRHGRTNLQTAKGAEAVH